MSTTLRIMGSQVTGGLEISEPCYTESSPSFLEGPMILREAIIPINILHKSGQIGMIPQPAKLPSALKEKIVDAGINKTISNGWIHCQNILYLEPQWPPSIFEGQPLKTMPFPNKTRVIWVLGIYCLVKYIWSLMRFQIHQLENEK